MLTWNTRGEDFFSTPDGRFDLLAVGHTPGLWLAIDADHGRTFSGSRIQVEEWCEYRVRATATPRANRVPELVGAA